MLILIVLYLFCILCVFYIGEPLYCCDEFQEKLKILQDELQYWQNDILANQALYRDTHLENVNDNLLDDESKRIKQHFKEVIEDGRKNVYTSIKEISDLKSKYNAWVNAEIIVKRPLDDTNF